MTRAQFRILMLLTVVSGLVGGGLSDWLFRGLAARAAQTTVAPKMIEAQEFRLVDEKGNKRAALAFTAEEFGPVDKSPVLCFFDAAGRGRVGLGLAYEVPFLLMYDAAGYERVELAIWDEGRPRLKLSDDTGTLRAVIGSTTMESTITLFNDSSDVLWQAP